MAIVVNSFAISFCWWRRLNVRVGDTVEVGPQEMVHKVPASHLHVQVLEMYRGAILAQEMPKVNGD